MELLERIGEGFGLSGEVWLARIPGADEIVVVKFGDAASTEREAGLLEEIAPKTGIPVPRFIRAEIDRESNRGTLVLERVRGARQGDVLAGSTSAEAADLIRILARMHARWQERSELPGFAWLRVPDAALSGGGGIAPGRRTRFEQAHSDRLPSWFRAHLDTVGKCRELIDRALFREPRTLIHGDFHLDNVLFTRDGPVILDWQHAGIGAGVTDFARIFLEGQSGEQTAERHAEQIALYREELGLAGVVRTEAELATATFLSICRMLLGVVGWLGGEPSEAEHPRVPALKANLLENTIRATEILLLSMPGVWHLRP